MTRRNGLRPSPIVQLKAVILKEIRQTARDKRLMAMLVFAPVMQLIVFGFVVNFDIDHVPTVIVDHDDTSTSRTHIRRMLADGTLREVARLEDEAEAEVMLEDGQANVVVIIPPGFGRDLGRGEAARVQVIIDGTNPNKSQVAASAVQRYFINAAVEQVSALNGGVAPGPSVRLAPRIFYNPELDTSTYMVPGIFAMLLVIITTIVTSMGLAREREVGTLEQIQVTPLSPAVVILGKLIPFAVIGLIVLTLGLTTATWIFDVPVRGSLLFLYGATALYLLNTLGVGLLISTVSRSQQQAFMAGFSLVMPAIMLSGVMSPILAMPEWLRPVTLINPVRYYGEVIRAVLLKGATPGDLWFQITALTVIGLTLIGLASWRFRKTMT
jgi:ABC-2 type transport system permease protein